MRTLRKFGTNSGPFPDNACLRHEGHISSFMLSYCFFKCNVRKIAQQKWLKEEYAEKFQEQQCI